MSGAAPTGAGGCSATAPRRRPAPAMRWRTGSRSSRAFPEIYRATARQRARAVLPGVPGRAFRLNRQRRFARLPAHARADERDLFRARLSRALSRLPAGRGRGSDRRATTASSSAPCPACKRTEVLLRRLDADFADPLELNAALAPRRAGPGAGGARRQGRHRQCARRRPGRSARRCWPSCRRLRRPCSAPTSPCPISRPGGSASPTCATTMIGKLDSMVIAPAFAERLAGDAGRRRRARAPSSTKRSAQRLLQSIEDRGVDYRGPGGGDAVDHAGLARRPAEPRPFMLRAVPRRRLGDGWRVMPGGFVRIADDADARAVSLQQGAATADAWVLARGRSRETTLLPTPERCHPARHRRLLPSRAADNLFWVGRYVERAEATLRLVRASSTASPTARAAPVIAPHHLAARRLECGAERHVPRAGRSFIARAALHTRRSRWLAAAHSQRCARGGVRHSRPLLARRLARNPRSRRHDRCAARRRSGRKRRCRARRGGAAHHFSLLRARTGEHDAACRLAFSRTRPPHRTRGLDLPAHPRVRRARHTGRQSRCAARTRRQPDHLPAALRHDRRAQRR